MTTIKNNALGWGDCGRLVGVVVSGDAFEALALVEGGIGGGGDVVESRAERVEESIEHCGGVGGMGGEELAIGDTDCFIGEISVAVDEEVWLLFSKRANNRGPRGSDGSKSEGSRNATTRETDIVL